MSHRLPIASLVAVLLLGLATFGVGASSQAAGAGVTAIDSPACGSVQYGGSGPAQALIVSDLPLQGDSRERSLQMNDAIRLVLEGAQWRAGGRSVAFQACDDSSAKTGLWTKAQCQANARAYAADPSVLGVLGTYNSGCAELEIPILGKAPGGGVAMVSPGNTLICLTQSSPSCPKGQPGSLYPGSRNYARSSPTTPTRAPAWRASPSSGRSSAPTSSTPPTTRPASARRRPSAAPPRSSASRSPASAPGTRRPPATPA